MQPKLKLLKILDILRETDESHPITAPAVCERLSDMGISAERKSVCRDINTLKEYGYNIVFCKDNKLGCYLDDENAAPIAPTTPVSPVTLDLVDITVEYKKENAEAVRSILGKLKETEDDDYIIAEAQLPSSALDATLFTLGSLAKLTAPTELRLAFENRLSAVSEHYKKGRDTKKIDVWLL